MSFPNPAVDRPIQLSSLSDDDRRLIEAIFERGERGLFLIHMPSGVLRVNTGELFRFGDDPVIEPIDRFETRFCNRFWDPEKLQQFKTAILHAPFAHTPWGYVKHLDSLRWQGKGTTTKLTPTEFEVEQCGRIWLVKFQGDWHRLVQMLEEPKPIPAQTKE